MSISYVLVALVFPPGCSEFQVFIDADRDPTTGYGGGYEYVVRVGDDPLSLRDWQQVQNLFGETVDLEGLGAGRVVRRAVPEGEAGGWGRLEGFALLGDGGVWVPFDGWFYVEYYDEGSWCR